MRTGIRHTALIVGAMGCGSTSVALGPAPTTTARPVAVAEPSFATAAEVVRPTVVFIRTMRSPAAHAEALPPHLRRFAAPIPSAGTGTSTGTGFVVRPDGYIVTNYHVVRRARAIRVRLFDQRDYRAEVVGVDSVTDVAVLRIAARDLPTVTLGNSHRVHVGQWVLAIGHPLSPSLLFTVTAGIVSATGRSLLTPAAAGRAMHDFIQTDAVANSGNSGGPLIDVTGRVIGMNAAIASETGYYQGYTLAIPSHLLRPIVRQLIRQGYVVRPTLEITAVDATLEDAAAVGLATVAGVVVQDVGPDSSRARRAGVRPGDVIVAVNGTAVTSRADFTRRVWFARPDRRMTLTVRRDGGRERTFALVPRLSIPPRRTDGPDRTAPAPSPCGDEPLGLCLVDPAPEFTHRYDITGPRRGPLVKGVHSAGPSHGKVYANLDLITHVAGRRVRTPADVERVLATVPPGTIVALHTYRFRRGQTGFVRVRRR